MTRSTVLPYHPSVVKKAFRAKAKQEGMTFKAAAEARTKQLKEQKFPSPVGVVRRNPGRMDGFTWRGSDFICSRSIDGPPPGDCDSDDTDYDEEYDGRPHTPDFRVLPSRHDALVIHSLFDIARPAKQRGVAKDFEMIREMRGVVALEEDRLGGGVWEDDYERWSEEDLEQWLEEDEDDWEEVYGKEQEKPKTYAAVLKER